MYCANSKKEKYSRRINFPNIFDTVIKFLSQLHNYKNTIQTMQKSLPLAWCLNENFLKTISTYKTNEENS